MNREANIVIPYLIGDTQKKMTVHAEVINNIVYKISQTCKYNLIVVCNLIKVDYKYSFVCLMVKIRYSFSARFQRRKILKQRTYYINCILKSS